MITATEAREHQKKYLETDRFDRKMKEIDSKIMYSSKLGGNFIDLGREDWNTACKIKNQYKLNGFIVQLFKGNDLNAGLEASSIRISW
jgi:hypothetical protein